MLRDYLEPMMLILLTALLISPGTSISTQTYKGPPMKGTSLSDTTSTRASDDVGVSGFGDLPPVIGPNSSIELGVYVTNYGTNNEVNITINVSYYHESDPTPIGYDETNVSFVQSGDTAYKKIKDFWVTDAILGNITIKAETRLGNDTNSTNNQSEVTVWIHPEPDLCINGLNLLSSGDTVTIGQPQLVSANIGNPGNMNQYDITVLLSVYTNDPSYNEVLNTSYFIDNISAFSDINIDIATFTPDTNTTYYIRLHVNETPDGDINPSNNTALFYVFAGGGASDLECTELSMYPAPDSGRYSPGTIVSMGIYVKNNGDDAVTEGNIFVSVQSPADQEVYNSTSSVYSLSPGQTKLFSMPDSWTVPSDSGTYTIKGGIMPADDNTANNIRTTTVDVNSIRDLEINNIMLNPDPDPNYMGGESVNITVYISNNGETDETIQTVSLIITDSLDNVIYSQERHNQYVVAGLFLDVTMGNWTVPSSEGAYKISASITLSSPDDNTSNDGLYRIVNVGSVIDVAVNAIYPSPLKSVYDQGEQVGFSVETENKGSDSEMFTLWLNITYDTELVYSRSIQINLGAGEKKNTSMSATLIFNNTGDYKGTAKAQVAGDMNPENNLLEETYTVVSSQIDLGVYSITPISSSIVREGKLNAGIEVKNYAYKTASAKVDLTLSTLNRSGSPEFTDGGEENGTMETYVVSGTNYWHTTDRFNSTGDKSWWFGDESTNTYPASCTSILYGGPIDLSSVTYAELTFDTMYDLLPMADYGYVVVSPDGNDWSSTPILSITGQANYWSSRTVSLADYTGSQIYIGFKMASGPNDKGDRLGWILDNITVQGYTGNKVNNYTETVSVPPLSTVSVMHNFTVAEGNYLLSAHINCTVDTNPDNDARTTFFTAKKAEEINSAPTAIIFSPANSAVYRAGSTVHFSASGSYDPDGDALTYSWDVNGEMLSTLMEFDHVFNTPGNMIVLLTVSDTYGASDKTSIYIKIEENNSGTTNITKYTTMDYTEDIVSVRLHYLNNYTPELDVIFNQPFDQSLLDQAISGIYKDLGIYFSVRTGIPEYAWDWMTVEVNYSANSTLSSITDPGMAPRLYVSNDGIIWDMPTQNSDLTKYTVTANVSELATFALFTPYEAPPIILPNAIFNASSVNITSGETVIFNASKSRDPDGTIETFQWNFGDGKYGEGPVVNHTFVNNGKSVMTFNVVLTVTDNDFNTNTTNLTIKVRPAANATTGNEKNSNQNEKSNEESSSISPVTIGIIVFVLILLIVIGGYFLLKARQARQYLAEFEEEEEEGNEDEEEEIDNQKK